jgi:hypothetical protein
LDASRAAREEQRWGRILPYGLVGLGVVALIVAAVVVIRRGT